ncbi:Dph2p [Sugiyamaella lignohabitans]|uniref:2-(3-amino-3-carboxypropyl)histidine synthase subunit 2 n=1 Tax=Sugiyamaella lignohabitans TaxID=796027 RepID=A0A167CSB5_9ASCO|nr:Dph2p [Sugiyamaella lignohabitans]ANB12050.1 Dph2p [Sugiyamaella lignohabitans]
MSEISIAAPVLSTESEFDKVALAARSRPSPSEDDLIKVYNLDQLVNKIVENDYKSIALQFPDDLIQDSTYISRFLSQQFLKLEGQQTRNVYILADTSYSPCCIDEVAAKHVNADVVVHFGNACLNPVRSFPVIYVFDSTVNVDMDLVETKFVEAFEEDPNQHILLVAETNYSIILNDLYERVKAKFPNCLPSSVNALHDDTQSDETTSAPTASCQSCSGSNGSSCCNATGNGSKDKSNCHSCSDKPSDTKTSPSVYFIPTLDIPALHTESTFLPTRRHPSLKTDLSDYKAFFITSPSPSSSFVLHLSTLVSSVTLLDVDTLKLSTPRTTLQKRYRYMNVARSASTIGLLINTLSLRNVNEVLARLKTWITQAGKKHYTFVVGKPNVPKLANFDVVDIWVVLGCSMGGIIVDCDKFYKPIITPYELNLALQSEVAWTGQWLIDFEAVLKMSSGEEDQVSSDISSDDDDAPVFDPISGKYVSTSKPLRRRAHIDIERDSSDTVNAPSDTSNSTNALATRLSSQLAIRGTVSTAAEYLHNKTTWNGLGSDFDESVDSSEGATVKEGRGGIARGYRVGETDRT